MSTTPDETMDGPEAAGEGPEVYRLAQSFSEETALALIEETLGETVQAIQRNEVAGSHAVFFAVTSRGERVLRVATHPEHDLALELWAEAQGRAAGVPVPGMLASVTTPRSDQLPFVISARASGVAAFSAELTPAERVTVFEQLGRYAARIHCIPVQGFGALRPDDSGSYVGADNSLAAWAERDLEESLGMLTALPSAPLSAAQSSEIRALFATVRAALDLPTAVLAHGDFRLKNVLVEGGTVTAVLDFEMAMAGDPALDLAWLLHSDEKEEAEREALLRGYEAEAPGVLTGNFAQRIAWYRLRYALIELWWAASFGAAPPAVARVEACVDRFRTETSVTE